ncbi:hypothetical protein MAPG_11957 [Magnaporthiopsis poae ATCC 64411]|uniref:Uncharacterized protein n=1 Tax=Magnaporthiopsis poae (strain ATCC 64411 / 73-15) TaxID=644358 RepID=A0A0C4EGK2_MAGP6|nr:hypothetical protein MAPG_11957 [Magnaporthiopsis poae ATCC 64411]
MAMGAWDAFALYDSTRSINLASRIIPTTARPYAAPRPTWPQCSWAVPCSGFDSVATLVNAINVSDTLSTHLGVIAMRLGIAAGILSEASKGAH